MTRLNMTTRRLTRQATRDYKCCSNCVDFYSPWQVRRRMCTNTYSPLYNNARGTDCCSWFRCSRHSGSSKNERYPLRDDFQLLRFMFCEGN